MARVHVPDQNREISQVDEIREFLKPLESGTRSGTSRAGLAPMRPTKKSLPLMRRKLSD